MNSKSEETPTSTSKAPGSGRPSSTILRLVPGGERQAGSAGSAEPIPHAQRKQEVRRHRDQDDDDPGPTAA